MVYNKYMAVDSATYQLPPVVRTAVVGQLSTSVSIEGTALKGAIQSTRILPQNGGVATGSVMPFSGSTVPSGYLLCNGQTFSNVTYPDLAAVLGDTFGVHSGASYYLPDLQNRVPYGKGTGIAATLNAPNALTTETVTLSGTQIPVHYHTGNLNSTGSNHTHWVSGMGYDDGNTTTTNQNIQDYGLWSDYGSYSSTDPQRAAGRYGAYSDHRGQTHTHAFTMNAAGGGGAHNNLQPYITLNYIIKT